MACDAFNQFKFWYADGSQHGQVIISSHGGRDLLGGRSIATGFKKQRVPAGVTLVFYGQDRSSILSYNIYQEFIARTPVPFRKKGPGDFFVDYELTKFQEEGVETYDDVKKCLSKYDVVTVRNRPLHFTNSIMLSEVISTLMTKKSIKTMTIHCSFCRSYGTIMSMLLGTGRPDEEMGKLSR